MELDLTGKPVFIAGASQGIGYAMAEAFLAEGARVMITGRGQDKLAAAEKALAADHGDRVASFAGDMTASADVIAALDAAEQKFGPLYCAVANVGIGRAPLGVDVDDEDWNADILQNFTGSMFVAREALKRFKALPKEDRANRNVIFISSIAGVDAIGTSLPYGATKAALHHATRAMAKLVGKDAIRINCIAPGNIMFDGGNWEKIVASDPPRWQEWINREVALRRFGRVEEIADAALFLASPRASFITGEVMVVDGGQVR